MVHEIPKWGTLEWYHFVKTNADAFAALGPDTFTKDGLLLCSNLIRVPTDCSYTLWLRKNESISVAPNSYASPVTNYISGDQSLWNSAAIRVVSGRGISGRALMFGVPFRQALNIALQKGFTKSLFFLPNQREGVYHASLLFHLNKRKDSNNSTYELQVWQYCPRLSEVFYVHAESSDFKSDVTHLDGAIIHFQPDEVVNLFTHCNKIKSVQYEKQFRLDGRIPIQDMLNIVSAYLPVTELVDEAFQFTDGTTTYQRGEPEPPITPLLKS